MLNIACRSAEFKDFENIVHDPRQKRISWAERVEEMRADAVLRNRPRPLSSLSSDTPDGSDFTVGQVVDHRTFGRGTISKVHADTITVDFKDGKETLVRRFAHNVLTDPSKPPPKPEPKPKPRSGNGADPKPKRADPKATKDVPVGGAIDLNKIREVVAWLASLDPDEYEVRRGSAAADAGVRITVLDKLVEKARGEACEKAEITKREIELWPEVVNGVALLTELVDTFKTYVIMTEAERLAAALWTLLTHAHDAFVISPYLAAVSPLKGCGKSTLLSLLGEITASAEPVASISAAAVYRAIEQWHPTLLMDEADKYLGSREDLQGIVNSAHNRRLAFAVRCVEEKKKIVAKKFSTWTPIALAWKGEGLPDTIDDRSIPIRLRKKLSSETVKRFRADRVESLQALARKCARWAQDSMDALRSADPSVPEEITNDRHADNWRTLLSIADVIGGEWPKAARRAAIEIETGSIQGGAAQSLGIQLLSDVRDAFKSLKTEATSALAIIGYIVTLDENPWDSYKEKGRHITGHAFAKLLVPFKISSHKVQGNMWWRKADFKDAWERYLPPDGEEPKPREPKPEKKPHDHSIPF